MVTSATSSSARPRRPSSLRVSRYSECAFTPGMGSGRSRSHCNGQRARPLAGDRAVLEAAPRNFPVVDAARVAGIGETGTQVARLPCLTGAHKAVVLGV